MALAVIGVTSVRADDVVNTYAIVGTWYGNMHFSDVNQVERIRLTIPTGCTPGSMCGSLPAELSREVHLEDHL